MTTIETNDVSVATAFRTAANRGTNPDAKAPNAKNSTDATKAEAGRSVHDTVSLSEGGQKIVNLARGAELATDLKTAPVDETFAAKLKAANDDVFRIANLFGSTLRALFSRGS